MKPNQFFTILLLAALAVAATIPLAAYADDEHPFAMINITNTSISYIYPLKEGFLGSLKPCQEVIYSLHAEAKWYHFGLSVDVAPVAVRIVQGPRDPVITAGIDFEPYPKFHPVKIYVHLVIYVNDKKYADKTIDEISWNQGVEVDASLDIVYRGNYIYVMLSSSQKTISLAVAADKPEVKLFAITHETDHVMSYVHKEGLYNVCNSQTTTYSNPGSQSGDPEKKKDKDNNDGDKGKLLVYAVAGLGVLVLLAAVARPGGGVVVVRGRGMFQLVALGLLLAFLAGGLAAWRLSSMLHSGSKDDAMIYAVAALGLLLLFFLVLAMRRPQVVVVEGG